MKIVEDRAHAKLNKAKDLLKAIETEMSLSADQLKDFNKALKPIHLILQYLGERKF